jgi:hypothetical protein
MTDTQTFSKQIYYRDNPLISNYPITFDENGYLYAVSYSETQKSGTILKINPDGKYGTTLSNNFNGFPPMSMIYVNGNLYGGLADTGSLIIIDSTGAYKIFSTITNTGTLINIKYYNGFIYAFLVNKDMNGMSPLGVYKISITDGSNSIFISKDLFKKKFMWFPQIEIDNSGNLYILYDNIMKFNGNGILLNDNFITGNYLYYFTFYNNFFYCLNFNLSQSTNQANQANSENKNFFSLPTSSIITKYDLNGVFMSNNTVDLSFSLIASDNNGSLYFAEKNVIYKINIAPPKTTSSQITNVIQDSGSSGLCMMCILLCCIMLSSSSSAMLKPF